MYGPEQAALFLNKAYKISRYASQRVFKEMQGFPGNQANFGGLKVTDFGGKGLVKPQFLMIKIII